MSIRLRASTQAPRGRTAKLEELARRTCIFVVLWTNGVNIDAILDFFPENSRREVLQECD